MPALPLAVAAALAVSAPGAAPAPDAPLPSRPAAVAARVAASDAGARAAIRSWRTPGRPASGGPPADVTLWALDLQRLVRLLSRKPALATAVRAHLRGRLGHDVVQMAAAVAELRRLSAGWPPHHVRTGPAKPLGVLLGYYRAAQQRFAVGWHVLAAVNFVESAFGKLRNDSVSGAQGPMQFMPATWRAYGLGGDVHDPRDAVLGAANYLRRSGAPASYSRALYHYNPSPLYVSAVLRYARLIARDPDAVWLLYSWQVYERARHGERRVTGP
jgi:hypothetical protein